MKSAYIQTSVAALLAAACWCLAAPTAWAQEGQDIQDINETVFDNDPRLARKVSVRAEGIPVGELLTLIGEKTGVGLSASRDVADDKAVVFVAARPLRETLQNLAALLGERWAAVQTKTSTSSGEPPCYVLRRSLKIKQVEARLLAKAQYEVFERADALARALHETPQQLARRKRDDPIRDALSEPGGRLATAAYAALGPAQRDRLEERGYLDVAFDSLDEAWRESLHETFRDFHARVRQSSAGAGAAAGKPLNLAGSTVRLRVDEQRGRTSLSLFFAEAGIGRDIARVDNGREWLLPAHGFPHTATRTRQPVHRRADHRRCRRPAALGPVSQRPRQRSGAVERPLR